MFFLSAFLFLETYALPTLVAISESEVTKAANLSMVSAINHNMPDLIRGGDLLSYRIGPQGDLLFVTADIGELNRLHAEALNLLQQAVDGLQDFVIAIPLGQILQSRVFASVGPKLRVKMRPIGFVSAKIIDSFESVGINQVKYRVFLQAACEIRVVIPFISSLKEVTADIPLVTILIPGKVPDTYLNLPQSKW